MIHLPQKGYIFGYNISQGEFEWVPYTTLQKYKNPKDVTFSLEKEDIRNFAFVHGSYEQLCEGKMCVVREFLEQTDCRGIARRCENRACIHLTGGGVLLILGSTSNGNSKIVLKQ